ncbi:MAG: protein kinase, partial [Myxococcales bacterium]|nr:protein kinase [Myxococcales bacterium]
MTLARNLQLHPGVVLEGRYRIERRLGVGGMGEVFLATRLALGDAVAIKSMLPTDDSPQMRERFLVEVRAAARVRHPNVVEIHDFGEPAGGMPYMVMEHLEGPSLAEHLAARGRLTADETRAIFAELCAAVEAAHRRGVVHRDLKPANVILARGDDGRSRVKVLDFGIARIAGADARPLTSPGAIVGTACYMAPEQARGGEVGPAADIFALGVILYELSTGALPFRGDSQLSVLQRICAGVYPPPELHTPGLDAAIVSAIVAALATDPRARPPSAAALAELAGIARVPALAPATATSVMIEDVANRSTLGGHEPTVAAPAEATAQRVTAPPPATRREAHKAPQYQLFSGRERELDQLLGYLAEARRGEGPIAVVSAEPGMGKTRLVEEFAARARADGVAVLSSRFYDYEGSRRSPFAAFQAMLEDEAVALDGAPEPAAVFDALTAAILARAGGRRLALVFDDLQWASRVDLELIEHLHRSLRGRGGLVVATLHAQAASGELERWLATQARGRSCALLELAPLDVAAIRRVLVTALGDLRIRPQELQRLARATGGSPYHLEEVIRHLVARGRLAREGAGGWVCRPLDDVALPETVGALVRGHLQELAGHDALRRVLELAAVIGDEFSCETLALAAGLDEDELDELLEIA